MLLRTVSSVTEVIDLNLVRPNHKWADWVIRNGSRWQLVPVRGRVKWEKPQRSHYRKRGFRPIYNQSFNGQGDRLRIDAVTLAAEHLKIAPEDLTYTWLSVAVDIDGTFDAYWGPAAEMRLIHHEDGDDGLAIPMAPDDVRRYKSLGRCLAEQKVHVFPWCLDDHWACAAHRHWQHSVITQPRQHRIARAIEATAADMGLRPDQFSPTNDSAFWI